MISKAKLNKLLNLCMEKGCDFAEFFLEDTKSNNYEFICGEVENIVTSYVYGVGIRVIKGESEYYGYTNDISYSNLVNLIEKITTSLEKKENIEKVRLVLEKNENIHKTIMFPDKIDISKKISYMQQTHDACKNYSEEISKVSIKLFDKVQSVTIANTNGKYIKDERVLVRIFCTAIASNEETMQIAGDSVAGACGYEIFKKEDLEALGRKVAESLITILHADEIKGGVMDVVIHNAFGGVLLHEACVHSLEAELVSKNASVFSNMIGEKIASDIVTAVDDGTIVNQWGSNNIDDEGAKAKRTVLIENGILKSYLVDYKNSAKMNHQITGSGRRASYKYLPTARMTNTFFMPGKNTFEEIISKTKNGFFAKTMGGGSVDPSTGEFNFSVSEGYIIENGKITKPVRGATLVGSGKSVLLNIDMIADNLEFGYGICGASSGNIPVCVGQPTIRVRDMTVGGRGS